MNMIEKYFKPTIYIKDYRSLDLQKLVEKGIKVLCIDVDNTLLSPYCTTLSEDAKAFIQKVKDSGLTPCLISNNTKKRVQDVAEQVNVAFYSFSCKPCTYNYKKIKKDTACSTDEIAILGDQLITDVLGGKRMKFCTILQDPVTQVENHSGKITRKLESYVLTNLAKKENFRKGVYYDNL